MGCEGDLYTNIILLPFLSTSHSLARLLCTSVVTRSNTFVPHLCTAPAPSFMCLTCIMFHCLTCVLLLCHPSRVSLVQCLFTPAVYSSCTIVHSSHFRKTSVLYIRIALVPSCTCFTCVMYQFFTYALLLCLLLLVPFLYWLSASSIHYSCAILRLSYQCNSSVLHLCTNPVSSFTWLTYVMPFCLTCELNLCYSLKVSSVDALVPLLYTKPVFLHMSHLWMPSTRRYCLLLIARCHELPTASTLQKSVVYLSI